MTAAQHVLDVDPGYLGRAELIAQLRLARLQLQQIPADTAKHRWLTCRYNLLVAETGIRQRLQDGSAPSPRFRSPHAGGIPQPPTGSANQIYHSAVDDFQQCRNMQGRIPFPADLFQLWAQHKYSVMARSQSLYRSIGPDLAAGRFTHRELVSTLSLALAQPPDPGNLANAVAHMWGYVKAGSGISPEHSGLLQLIPEIQQRAISQPSPYLLQSTALGEFAYWCWLLDADNASTSIDRAGPDLAEEAELTGQHHSEDGDTPC